MPWKQRFLGNMVMGAVASNRKKRRLDPRDSPSRKQRRDGEHRRECSKEVMPESHSSFTFSASSTLYLSQELSL